MKRLILIAFLAASLPQPALAVGPLSLSQSNVALNVGSSVSITAYPALNQGIYVASVTNTFVAYANVSNNLITIYGLGNGSAQITFCTYDNSCGTVYVTVGGTGNVSNPGQISFSQNSVSLYVNQTSSVSIINSTGYPAYVSNNPNPNTVSAYISGNTVNLTGINGGSSTITVCANNSNQCGYLYVTVTGSAYTPVSFGQNSITMNQYQNQVVPINGTNSGYAISNNSNPNIVNATISGSSLNLYGQNIGAGNITVCASNGGPCATLYVSVNSTNNNSNFYFITANLSQPIINQYYSTQLSVTGGTAPYSFTLASGALPAGLYLSANGQIYGTMTTSTASTFMVRATDAYGRTATSVLFPLQPTGGTVLSASIYANGTLVKDDRTIYITYKNTKSGFANMNAFTGLGYSLRNVIPGSTSSLIQSGLVIANSSMAHPWGSWIKNGSTIYFVHDQGLIPIASYPIFLNNGGRDAWVVNANLADLNKPVQYLMDNNDSRLR